MATYPQFVAKFRQDAFDCKASFHNTPQLVFTPGEKGTRLHGISLANDADNDGEVQFGYAAKLSNNCRVNIVPGSTPASQPWTITRLDQGNFINDGWFTGAYITITQEAPHKTNRGDFKIAALSATALSLAPKVDIVQELDVTLTLWRWQPWWTVMVPRKAGWDKNSSISGLDFKQMPWLDGTSEPWLVITKPLWVRLPGNGEGTQGSITITLMGGDY